MTVQTTCVHGAEFYLTQVSDLLTTRTLIRSLCRVYELFSDRCARKVSLVLEYLDMDLYRLMRSRPELLPTSPDLVKVRRGGGGGREWRGLCCLCCLMRSRPQLLPARHAVIEMRTSQKGMGGRRDAQDSSHIHVLT